MKFGVKNLAASNAAITGSVELLTNETAVFQSETLLKQLMNSVRRIELAPERSSTDSEDFCRLVLIAIHAF